MVGDRGRLPGVHPQLRRRQRRRHRRHRGSAVAVAVPGGSRRRRGVDQPVVSVADGRRRLRRRRLPRHRTVVRHTGRGRSLHRRRAFRWASRCCWTSSPTTRRTTTAGFRPPWPPSRMPATGICSGPVRGAHGELPPNDWQSVFGGPAWTRLADDSWYLHLFAPGQPDLNWSHPEVRAEFEKVLAFWFDKGVDGFRIDVAHGLVKADGLPDRGALDERCAAQRSPSSLGSGRCARHLPWLARGGRSVCAATDLHRRGVGAQQRAAGALPAPRRTAHRVPVRLPARPWRASSLRTVIDEAIDAAASVGAPPTWVLSNHDVPRTVTRYSRSQPTGSGRNGLGTRPLGRGGR